MFEVQIEYNADYEIQCGIWIHKNWSRIRNKVNMTPVGWAVPHWAKEYFNHDCMVQNGTLIFKFKKADEAILFKMKWG